MASLHAWILMTGAIFLAAYGFATGPVELRAAGTLGFGLLMVALTMLEYDRGEERDDRED